MLWSFFYLKVFLIKERRSCITHSILLDILNYLTGSLNLIAIHGVRLLFEKVCFVFMGEFTYMYICAPLPCLVSTEIRKWCHIPAN